MSETVQAGKESIQLGEIGQIALTVRDLERARNFYESVLGMQFLFEAGTMAFFQCGAVRLMLGVSEKAEPSHGTILYFRVADIQAAHAGLKTRGVTILQEPHLTARMKSHDLWLSFFNDPDGNTLALMGEVERAADAQGQ